MPFSAPALSPPLVVLSGHRSGSSAFMGLLADAGLRLGELLPPAPDNPQGFFENRVVVDINRRLLQLRDRDWTCPPPTLDHRTVDRAPIAELRDELSGSSGPWGLKDPRMMFTLPAWAPVLGDIFLVGVHRKSDDVARSLVARNGFEPSQARAIALAYAQRLAEVHRVLDFPIVSFDSEPEVFLDRTGRIVRALNLDWNPDASAGRYDGGLVHHRSPSDGLHPLDDYLAQAAMRAIGDLRHRTPATILRIWNQAPADLARILPMDLGPRERARRDELFAEAVGRRAEMGEVCVVDRNAGADPLPGTVASLVHPDDLTRPTVSDARWSHVVAAHLLDETAPCDLPAVFAGLDARLDSGGVVAFYGSIVDSDRAPAVKVIEPAGITTRRTEPPHLHHLDQITAALVDTRLRVAAVEPTESGRTRLVLVNDPRMIDEPIEPYHLRERLTALTAKQEQAESTIAALRSEAGTLRAEVDRHGERNEALERREAEMEAELKELRPTLRAAEQELEDARSRVAELEHLGPDLEAAHHRIAELEHSYTRLANRRIVKFGLAMARPVAPVFRLVRRLGSRVDRTASVRPRITEKPAKRATRQTTVERIKALRTTPYAESGPLVSIIILTRNGAHHLRRLFPGLAATAYRSFEVIVVDNGSTDDTTDVLGAEWGFPIRVVENDHNTSFSVGNNRAVAHANGELLLLLNNDIEPITEHWLGAMVAAATATPAPGAVGALLVYPDQGDPATDLTVQHRGIGFGFHDGAPRAHNLGGDDPATSELTGLVEAPATTAAAVMIDKERFVGVGGFTEGYVFGSEDVDLCLKLRQTGPIVVQRDAALFHYESATQSVAPPDLVRINRERNWQLFAETWGPTLTRSILKDRLRGEGRWTGRPGRSVAITITRGDPNEGYGDYYTAHELGDELAAAGWTVHYAERHQDHWYDLPDDLDMVIVLLDAFDVRRVPEGVYRVAWVRNWVDRWLEKPWIDEYDLVVASSASAAAAISETTPFQCPVIPIATNPTRFAPGPSTPTFEADYTFTGSNWGRSRDLIGLLDVRPGERFLLFGKHWDQDPRVGRYWRGMLDYEHIPELYRSVKIVLDDTADHTIEHGFVNSRVFDALAAGALVLTNNRLGSDELFDGLLPVYEDRQSLRRLLDHYLHNDEERDQLVRRLREIVLAEHSYRRRAHMFLDVVIASIDRPRIAVKVGAPSADKAHAWGDYHFARSLLIALGSEGFAGEVHLLPDWDAPARQRCDVVLHLRGLTTYAPKASQINLMWLISHPDEVSPEECEKYDVVCVASPHLARDLSRSIDRLVVYLPQATDPQRFGAATPDDDLRTQLLFVGNSRLQPRHAVMWAVAEGLPLTVYGGDWDGLIPASYVRDTYFPNERLGALYASARVVLNDHWPDMSAHGIVSNRILDALAAGTVVVSDPVGGLDDLVDDAVPTFTSPDELASLVHRLLEDDEWRDALIAQGRKVVLDQHTFAQRASELASLIEPLLAIRQRDCDGGWFTPVGHADR